MEQREIKFRAWDVSGKSICDWSMIKQYPLEDVIDNVRGFILMQYTGREDAEINGKEVYENDIIQNCDTKDLQVVFWNEHESAWYCRYLYTKERIVSLADSLGNLNKVVGNIYENPELIK